MRVAHITEAPRGGVLSYLEEVIPEQLRAPEIERIIAVLPAVNAGSFAHLGSAKLILKPYPHARGSLIGMLRLAWHVLAVLVIEKPDIVHVHSTFAGVIVRLCAVLVRFRGRLLYCPHGWSFLREGSPRTLLVLIERILAFRSDRIICISDHEWHEAVQAGLPARKCVTIKNGIAPPAGPAPPRSERGRPLGPRRLKILYVGRFDRQKGFDLFLDAMRRVPDRAEGLAVGDYLTDPGRSHAPPANVTIRGWCDRSGLDALYRDADLLLIPSRWEGFGLVAIEAMRAGLPIFASRVGGLEEIVVDGETGRLFACGDVEQIVTLVTQVTEADLARFGRAGYDRFQAHHRSDRMNSQLLKLYAACARADGFRREFAGLGSARVPRPR
ncbi:glycosyltransferase [Methylobacterium soli]|uniref:Glycosyltransferase family 4 protein n=1 Tax=Methylobacterium soli TaxID=553447 RepID=A0A6L3SX88_9HYPH|nr:glycosyltransferase [Methylobacterium soli]KAB1078014.1 glycosyltransferase family 4 protein [Methylobacterium soli]GJE42572.1 D-inositol-3-phosphate glycosyltransferase [Methylobacterium soli]